MTILGTVNNIFRLILALFAVWIVLSVFLVVSYIGLLKILGVL